MKLLGYIKKSDVGTRFLQVAPDKKVWVEGVLGRIQEIDVGKAVYDNGGVIQVENLEQMQKRLQKEKKEVEMKKNKIVVETKSEIVPTTETAGRILESILVNEYEVPVGEFDMEVRHDAQGKPKIVEVSTGEKVSTSSDAAVLLVALCAVQDLEIPYKKAVLHLDDVDGCFVLSLNGRVVKNFMYTHAGNDQAKILKQRGLAKGHQSTLATALKMLGFKVFISNSEAYDKI